MQKFGLVGWHLYLIKLFFRPAPVVDNDIMGTSTDNLLDKIKSLLRPENAGQLEESASGLEASDMQATFG